MKKYSRLFLIAVAFALLAAFVAQRDGVVQDKAQKIDALINIYHHYRLFNGSLLVAEHGQVITKRGVGLADMEWRIPNAPDTKFRLGSITKQFTSMLIMQLVEQGKLKLEGTISEYLPDYRKDIGEKVTIHHLLTHTSGIPSYTGLPGFMQHKTRDPYAVDEFVKMYCSGDLQFEPGSRFAYNNSGYFLLGAIIEKVAGKTYEQVLKEKILDPLNMTSTGYDHHDAILSKRAAGYRKTLTGYENAPYLDMTIPYAAGSLYSTVEDLYLWDQALYTEKLLSERYKDLMFKPNLKDYAYGWVIVKVPIGEMTKTLIQHGGGIYGFNTLIVRLVDDRHLVVLLNNTGGTVLNQISRGIINILYDQPYDLPKESIAETLVNPIEAEGVKAAIAQYRQLKRTQAEAYDFREAELNRLGYYLLQEGRVKDAIDIFKLNVEVYPQDFNVYDSLAEAYMVNGDKELAIKNYAKSLQLNPKNTNAIEKLNELAERKE